MRAFGAVEKFRTPGPDGKIGHAEMQLGTSVFMLADENPEMNARGPKSVGGSPVSLIVYVEDVAPEEMDRRMKAQRQA